MTAQETIVRSTRHNEIVHLPFDAMVAEELLVECDEHVTNGAVEEYWGTCEGGATWRVHLERREFDEMHLSPGA